MRYKDILTVISKSALLIIIMLTSLVVFHSLTTFFSKHEDNHLEAIAETVELFAVQCYTFEGSYPPDIEYLEENYGLVLDREKYIYIYDAFSSNIRPDVRVIENDGYSGNQ
ncbi:hypothetical protein EZV73_19230 [Acidaminobacter sp. JC074]|uniref:hypothetical protein n=1 Tax=Acidaminobacter sp. JC074 TaxID=2530199 RepID=UPI001F0F163C|nr:hypothetical protein [Acidaminobacter sp. JC074]MCH4889724.1 hypothetical protein [Acidaminobacter sp. JC074]